MQRRTLDLFLGTARKYIGTTAGLLGRTTFGERVGYQSGPWSGAFVDVVARESGLRLPSFTYSPAALAEAVRSGNTARTPKPGDIAIFNFPSTSTYSASAFHPPHVGIVTDVRELRNSGRFLTIEGNTTGTQQQQQDGVYQKTRFLTDVILFVRPEEFTFKPAARILQLINKLIQKYAAASISDLQEIKEAARTKSVVELKGLKPGTRNKQIMIVQLALSQVTDLRGVDPGKWDGATTAAFSRYQRSIGRVGSDADGSPDLPTLQRLAEETGLFKIHVG